VFKEFSELRHARNFRRAIFPISTAFFIYTFGWGITSPIFSIYVNNITGSEFLTGLVLSITTMGGVFLSIPVGIVEDKLNMKRVLQVVLLVYTALALLYPVADTLLPLLLASITRGVASSFLWLTSWAYILSYTDKRMKGKETGFFSDMNDLASALAPVLGGFVVVFLGFLLPFYVLALACFAAFTVISLRLKEVPKPAKASFKTQMRTLAHYIHNRRFGKTVFLIVVFYALINVYYSFLSLFLYSEGISISWIGIILTVSMLPAVALEVPMGNLIDRYGIKKTLSVAVVLTTFTAALLPLLRDINHILLDVIAFTASYTMIFIALYSRMSDVMRENKVAMTGAISTFKDLGYTLGPLSAGFLMQWTSIGNMFLIVGGSFAILLPVALSLHD
jgi:DHA1 family multidrug resistance protein-like MFS transporter